MRRRLPISNPVYVSSSIIYDYTQHIFNNDDSSIFFYCQIPAKMYDECLRDIMTSDPEALDQLLNRKCYEQG